MFINNLSNTCLKHKFHYCKVYNYYLHNTIYRIRGIFHETIISTFKSLRDFNQLSSKILHCYKKDCCFLILPFP